MTLEILLAFGSFAFVTSVTPGPNNAMLLASGATYGFLRTVPHIAGISLGCAAMLLLVGLGLGTVFAAAPILYDVLRYAASAYLLWLAWKIARSGQMTDGRPRGRPMTALQAAAFQWVNPKAWILVMGAAGSYAPREGFSWNVAVLATLLALVNAPTICLWAAFGTVLKPLLSSRRRIRALNVTMALLLVASLIPMAERLR